MPISGCLNELEVISVVMYHGMKSGVCHFFYLGGGRVDCSVYVSEVRVLIVVV